MTKEQLFVKEQENKLLPELDRYLHMKVNVGPIIIDNDIPMLHFLTFSGGEGQYQADFSINNINNFPDEPKSNVLDVELSTRYYSNGRKAFNMVKSAKNYPILEVVNEENHSSLDILVINADNEDLIAGEILNYSGTTTPCFLKYSKEQEKYIILHRKKEILC